MDDARTMNAKEDMLNTVAPQFGGAEKIQKLLGYADTVPGFDRAAMDKAWNAVDADAFAGELRKLSDAVLALPDPARPRQPTAPNHFANPATASGVPFNSTEEYKAATLEAARRHGGDATADPEWVARYRATKAKFPKLIRG